MPSIPDDLRRQLGQYGQEHVLAWWDALTENQRHSLLLQLQGVNLAQLHRLYEGRDVGWSLPPLEKLQPIEPVDLTRDAAARQRGEEVLRQGKVAVLVVAGGQGTRLGADQPKGLFPVGPVSGKSLYQIHAEKVLALRRRYGSRVPFLIMTSPATDHPTRQFFADHGHFGLPAGDVHFFCQGTMPALDIKTGKLLMAAPHHLCLSPNGHGGTLLALRDSGLLRRLQADGIDHLFFFQVDNPLVQVADPAMLGHHCERQAEVTNKVLAKASPEDKLGNYVQVDGRCHIIEYFLLPKEWAAARDAQGKLRFGYGSPAIHIFDVDFLARALADEASLPYHLAEKKVPHIDAGGNRIEPAEPNAYKFEMFIFDLLPLAERWSMVLTTREREFAPLKNNSGPDSPETVGPAMCRLAVDWLRRAGADVPDPAARVEIGPLYALDAEELRVKIKPGFRVEGPTHLS